MHALDDRIHGDNESVPGGAIDQRGVIREAEAARSGQRRKEPRDAAELAKLGGSHVRPSDPLAGLDPAEG